MTFIKMLPTVGSWGLPDSRESNLLQNTVRTQPPPKPESRKSVPAGEDGGNIGGS